MRDHGGNLQAAKKRFGGDTSGWLDLSTGINARPYPVGTVSAEAWNRLPERACLTQLEKAAQVQYRTSLEVVAVAGAQAAIQLVPLLHKVGQAAIVTPTYNEHAAALRAQGWTVDEVQELSSLKGKDLAVVVTPNNPDGRRHAPVDLLQLSAGVGLLVVDESFVDTEPHLSIASWPVSLPENLLILRSFGKFYGLAGLRLGFVLCGPKLCMRLRDLIGPWPVSGVALSLGERALKDTTWAEQTTARLLRDAAHLDVLAQRTGWDLLGGTPLFRTYETGNARTVQMGLAQRHIWTRIFPYSSSWIRIGLPGANEDWRRLDAGLAKL